MGKNNELGMVINKGGAFENEKFVPDG